MTPPTFRLFLSSPGDVAVERRRVADLVSRINGECAGRARIETIRWETASYQAFSTFQAQIPLAVECDLVLTIFKWRLGTELPPAFPDRMDDGEPYPSGTAYELLTSMEQRRSGAATPDVFVFRYGGSSPRPEIDDPDRERIERDWSRLKGFFERFFLTPEGHFKAAFQFYASEDDLDAQIDALLRRWLEDKIAAGRILAWPDAIKGSPFPGLEAYGQRHASVFFGRDRDIARSMELWRDAAGRGSPFLLVVGSSGAGKSSLVRAGLLPRLTTPGVIEAVDGWRAAALRPADNPDGPLAALADALLATARDLPPAEEGRGPSLPEILGGEIADAAALAARLADDPASVAEAAVAALDGIGSLVQASERRERAVRTDLVLVVDQLDELFSPTLPEGAREGFVRAVAALVATGRVWIAATLRADLYAAMLDDPGLKALKDAGAAYDLAPPGGAELAEIVRRPAQAADLAFGTDPATGEGVDERLLREADRPDMLPLVQLALSRLYEGRMQEGDRTVLPFGVYAALGGLTGIIDEVGERALAELAEGTVAGLPRLVRGLAQTEGQGALAGTLTVRPLPLAGIEADPARRSLVEALVGARLLTVSGTDDAVQVRLAHQRVLTDWVRVRDIVAGSADFYRVRAEVERQRERWAENRRGDLLLPRGLPLAEAESMVSRYGDEVDPQARAFVKASRARAGRAQAITAGAAVVFAVVAVVAVFQYGAAKRQTALAERNFGISRDAVKGVVQNIVQGLIDVAGMRVDALRIILTTVQTASDQLASTAPDDPALLRSRAAMFDDFSKVYLAAGDAGAARTSAESSVAILRQLLARDPNDMGVKGDLAIPLVALGDAMRFAGDVSGATALYEEALQLARAAAAGAPDDPSARIRMAVPLHRLGEARYDRGDLAGSRMAYRELLDLARREAVARPTDLVARKTLDSALSELAYLDDEAGEEAAARAGYEESLSIARALVAEYPANAALGRTLVTSLTNLAELDIKVGQVPAARARLAEALGIDRATSRADPDNLERRRGLAITLEKVGSGAFAAADWAAASDAYGESLAIFRDLAARNPDDVRQQASVAIGLQNVAAVQAKIANGAAARAATDEQVAVDRRIVERQPANAQARRALALALRDLGDLRRDAGENAPALALYAEAVTIARALTEIDPDNPAPFRTLNEILAAQDLLQRKQPGQAGLAETMDAQERSLRRLVLLRPAERSAQAQLAEILLRVGVARAIAGARELALATLHEASALRRVLAAGRDPASLRLLAGTLEVEGKIALIYERRALAGPVLAELVAVSRDLATGGGPQTRIALASALVLMARASSEPVPLLREAVGLLDGLTDAEVTDASRALRTQIGERMAALPPDGPRHP